VNTTTAMPGVPSNELEPAVRLHCEPDTPPEPLPHPDPGPGPGDPLPPPDPSQPRPEPAGPDAAPIDDVADRPAAARLLSQATFGPTMVEIDALVDLGSVSTWIERQIAQPISRTLPYVRANGNGSLGTIRHHIWWKNAIEGPDQLRQRVAFALSEIFVVSDRDYEISNAQYGISGYYDMLAELAFGDFRTLLERVTLHPIMGIYLSMLRNEKADPARNIRPDENFAREVLQLFTIGLYELAPDGTVRVNAQGEPVPTYDQETIEQFAKVFTGWNLSDAGDVWVSNDLTKFDKEDPMVPLEQYHDRSAKVLLGGTRLPAGQDARTDLEAALDNIVAHQNVGPFVARSLIQRLVTSNPTPAYIARVGAAFDDDGSGRRGNLGAVVTAILTDPEARSGQVTVPDRFGKVIEPMIRLTRVWRAFDASPGRDTGIYRPKAKALLQLDDIIGQGPLESPSVFNFFSPGHKLRPGGDMLAPEAQLLSEIGVASMNNLLHLQIYSGNSRVDAGVNVVHIDIEREVRLAGNGRALAEHLDLLLCSGALPDDFLEAIAVHVDSLPDDADGSLTRALDAIFCVVGSPFHLVQK